MSFVAIPLENITTSDLIHELTQRADLEKDDLFEICRHLLGFVLPEGFDLYHRGKLVTHKCNCKTLDQYDTAELAQDFFTRDDCDQHFDPHYLYHFIENPESIPVCYLVLKADNLHDQQVLADLKDTFKMMAV